ncbi:hypothetical protein EHQ12_03220 [Leptospira gomenensis]|uniref:Uncharacterized protein n=1 Tax=Leptospira gomenensis TaxID=2484974 RepID=A0A5F1Y7Z6_9LEPT|nr:DUF6157 family protein [Leptospira gomenensis]TGK31068.1 hypothetical protein EHQ17_15255 [Leptospira gomenensis]TGK43272.1 hypothetical protein EHQ12_03220 [Leptospira gomenensis]TGK45213.1 hypothetical protein EHQ07_09745 [Leptospira gomenensis]TGK66127.1 hypothetical protein EHQ13_03480 [Leptospira gomenensis]
MKTHTTNYLNTFIEIAEDCPAVSGEIPPLKGENKTVANLQFDMVKNHPYRFTSDDVLFEVFAIRNDIKKEEYTSERERFFSKGQPCFRASPLTKRYGWGVHSDAEGKIAVYGCESAEYKKFSRDKKLKVIRAMRSGK